MGENKKSPYVLLAGRFFGKMKEEAQNTNDWIRGKKTC